MFVWFSFLYCDFYFINLVVFRLECWFVMIVVLGCGLCCCAFAFGFYCWLLRLLFVVGCLVYTCYFVLNLFVSLVIWSRAGCLCSCVELWLINLLTSGLVWWFTLLVQYLVNLGWLICAFDWSLVIGDRFVWCLFVLVFVAICLCLIMVRFRVAEWWCYVVCFLDC